VRNRVLDEYRKQERRVEYTGELEEEGAVPVALPPEAHDADDDAMTVERIIAAMSPQRRAVCTLVHEEGLTLREAAEQLGITYATARRHMKLAMIWIRGHMPPDVVKRLLGRTTLRLPRGTPPTLPGTTEAAND
jgi:RNA polymerase sigma factor (sigma-70 family)